MIGTSVTLGIILSFLFSEFTGLLAGGLVSPGYLALYMDQPLRVLATLAVAGLTLAAVKLASLRLILFGRRRFMAMVLTGMLIGWLLGRVVSWVPGAGQEIRVVGYIIPGLIANDASKQGFLKTAAATVIIAGLVRLILLIVY